VLADYARSGGNLIFTGRTAMADPYNADRDTDLLAELLGAARETMTTPTAVGDGRALWIADDPGRIWEKSSGAADLTPFSDVVKSMGGGQQIRVEGAADVTEVTCYAQAQAKRIILHFDNQKYGEARPDISVSVQLPDGWTQRGPARHLDLDGAQRDLGSADALTVPTPEVYSMVVIDCD